MPASAFDTNVLVCLTSDPVKAGIVRSLLVEGGTISVQVLNELANVGRKRLGLKWLQVHDLLIAVREALTVTPLTIDVHETALRLAERYRLSFYDSAIVAAALIAGCDRLWSEDMHDGLVVDGRLTICNPFSGGEIN